MKLQDYNSLPLFFCQFITYLCRPIWVSESVVKLLVTLLSERRQNIDLRDEERDGIYLSE